MGGKGKGGKGDKGSGKGDKGSGKGDKGSGKGDKGSGKGDKGSGKGDKGSGKGKAAGKKGGDKGEKREEQGEKTPRVFSTDGRPYAAALQDLFKGTAVRPVDIDPKAVQLFDALAESGKADAACAHLAKSLEGVAREKVVNWRAYVFTLLRGYDAEIYNSMKDQRGRPRPRRKDEKITAPLVTTELKASAPEFVPGQSWGGCKPPSEAPRPAATTEAAKTEDKAESKAEGKTEDKAESK